jgi:hypothetical protein
MKESRLKNKIRKLVYKNLDQIYKTSKTIAADWDSKTIPLDTLKVILDKSRPNINTGVKELDLFNIKYCNMLETLYKTCTGIAKKMQSKSIPISLIKNGIELMKKAFKDGQ